MEILDLMNFRIERARGEKRMRMRRRSRVDEIFERLIVWHWASQNKSVPVPVFYVSYLRPLVSQPPT